MKYLWMCLVLLLSATMTGCSFNLKDPAKPWYYPDAGTKLVLHQQLTIPPGSTALYFQHGEATGTNRDHFTPYCKIEIRTLEATPQVIYPDTFTITRSGRYTDMFSSTGLVVATAGGVFPPSNSMRNRVPAGMQIAQADAPSDITETIQMRLSSRTQPAVYNLECGGAEDHPANAEPPTFSEMKEALGDIMSFRLNP